MKKALDAVLAGRKVPVLVDRQKDIVSDVAKAISRSRGAAVSILFTGYKRVNGVRNASYAIAVWAHPVIGNDEQLADDIVEVVDSTLHSHIPESLNPARDNCHFRIEVEGGSINYNPNFLIYQLNINVNIK